MNLASLGGTSELVHTEIFCNLDFQDICDCHGVHHLLHFPWVSRPDTTSSGSFVDPGGRRG